MSRLRCHRLLGASLNKITACLAASAALTAASAFAADMPVKAPPPAAVYSWTGFYVGLNAGYGLSHQTFNYFGDNIAGALFVDPSFIGVGGVPRSFDATGFVGGGQIGYNWQFRPNWVAGIEADIDFSNVRGSTTFPTGNGAMPGYADRRLEWFGTVRPRLGFLPTDQLLIYATGGLAYGQTKASSNFTMGNGAIFRGFPEAFINCPGFGGCVAGSNSRTFAGWTLGAGFEYALWSNVSLKAEYLYVKLPGETVLMTVVPPSSGNALVSAVFDEKAFQVVRAGVNYKF